MNYINQNLIFKDVPTGKVGWQSPSNIALVKYWGKNEVQIPANPSISFTLNESHTDTTIEFLPATKDKFNVDFFFEGKLNEQFASKISTFFNGITDIFPFISQLDFVITSKNTFPHSAGIASSASGMSAIALALCEIERKYFNSFINNREFYKKASYVARLGSGSACRSIYGGLVGWGKIKETEYSSNLFGSQLTDSINPIFNTYRDSILIVDSSQKKVSSRVGHGLMNSNPFSQSRFEQANQNISRLLQVLKSGDLVEFIQIVESEALTLHAMMMTSTPYFQLMKPNTISIIDKVWDYRNKTGTPVCFTLDAGPNIHLLYPNSYKSAIRDFINSELLQFTVNNTVIHDNIGGGPKNIVL
ncbi:MAG: diphosphomevalonate decarboxylase [Bacteroidota bacterium]